MNLTRLFDIIFSNKLVTDERQPIFTFELPEYLGGDATTTFGFVAPEIMFWIQLVAILTMNGICGAIAGYTIYEFIVLKRGSATSYLVGYGVIIPICILFPYIVLPMFELKNKILKFSQMVLFPVLTMFRCSEAMYDFSPPSVEKSRKSFIMYHANIPQIFFDPKTDQPVKSSWVDAMMKLNAFIRRVLVVGAFSSLLSPFDYQPWGDRMVEVDEGLSISIMANIRDLFRLPHLLNNLMSALLFECYLNMMLSGIVAVSTIWGFQPEITMKLAVLGSTSPSDFWGRKWNLVIHRTLKRGVFKPVRRYFSRHVAMTASFLASGLFHEWILSGIFLTYESINIDECTPRLCHKPIYGKTLGFFLWNGAIIAMEYLFSGFFLFQWVKRSLPIPIVSLMVVSLALPVAHWMTHNYITSDFFQNGELGFPMIIKVSKD